MKKMLIFGATGKLGSLVFKKAIAAGYSLRVLVRNKNKLPHTEKNVEIFEGDVTNPEDINKVISGVDTVVSCLGTVKKQKIMEVAFDNILTAAAKQKQPPKCFMVTTVGCGGSSLLVKIVLTIMTNPFSNLFVDYEKADKRVREEQNVPCLLVRPYALTNGEERGYNAVTKKKGTFLKPISRVDVAQFLVDATGSDTWDSYKAVLLGGVKQKSS